MAITEPIKTNTFKMQTHEVPPAEAVPAVASPRWLDRQVHPLGPFLALATSQAVLDEMISGLGATNEGNFKMPPPGVARTYTLIRKETTDTTPSCIVCMHPGSMSLPSLASIMAHEACHIFEAHLRDIGESEPSSEFRAYGIQWITYTLLEEWERLHSGAPAA